MENEIDIEDKLKDKMLDPSLLYRRRFWNLKLPENVFVPESFLELRKQDVYSVSKFYKGAVSKEWSFEYKDIKKMLYQPDLNIRIFDRHEYIQRMPQQFLESYSLLENAEIEFPIKEILLDELVFLATKSCLLSALKKVFKIFEWADVFPIVNLEEKVPDEWKKTVRGVKKSANWIGFLAGFYVSKGDVIISLAAQQAVNYVRLVLIDP